MSLAVRYAAFSVLLAGAPFAAAKQPVLETDLLKIGRVTEVQMTPDGSAAVFGVQTIHTEPPAQPHGDPAYAYRVNLWLVRLGNGAAKPVQLTFGDRRDRMLALSPDGQQLAFVRDDISRHAQVWLLPLLTPGEPRALTHLETGATNPKWSPDGKSLLINSDIPISQLPGKPPFDQERPGRTWWDFTRPPIRGPNGAKPAAAASPGQPDGDLSSIRDWLERNAERNNPSDLTRINFLAELNLAGELTFSELYLVDPATDGKITPLTHSFRDHLTPAFSPDGSRIVFGSEPESTINPDRLNDRGSLWEMAVDGSAEHALPMGSGFTFSDPHFTADGKHLVVVGRQNDQPFYRQAMLGVCDPDGAHLAWLTKDGDSGVQAPLVLPDGNVYYTIDWQGGQWLRSVNLATHAVSDLIGGPVGVNAFSAAAGQLVYARIAAENPNELYGLPLANVKPGGSAAGRRLTEINSTWLEAKEIALPEEHWLTRPDGTRVEYWVMPPTHAEPGRKYPWVLDMHGGPSAMWGPGEFTMWHEFQMFCAFGYGVVYANPRGSSGYGYLFQRANYRDWGAAPMADIMASLDATIASHPAVDPDRLFVTGGSYAGYMTAWIIGHSDRFKAAAALRGVYDLTTFFGEGNAFRLVPEEFGGYPWEPATRRLLDEESPLTYVTRMKTPLLIIHGSSDNRTGVVQGQMLFRALKQLNRPVEYVRYPGAGHEITRSGEPLQRMDHMLRVIEFFERYSHNSRPAPVEEPNSSAALAQTGVQ